MRYAAAILFLLAPLPAIGAPPEIGPSDLRSKSRATREKVAAIERQALEDAARWIAEQRKAREESVAAFADLVARQVPGGDASWILPDGPAPSRLDRKERDRLNKIAASLVKAAAALRTAELGASAGFEAYLALGLDPSNKDAGKLLGYTLCEGAFRHPRVADLRAKKLALTRFGWIAEAVAEKASPGLVPEGTEWVEASEADGRHATWPTRHTLTYTFAEYQTALPVEQVTPWAERVDAGIEWMRARFNGVPGYVEPKWPLLVRIYRDPGEAQAAGDRPPQPFAHWLQGVGVVNAAAFGPTTMPMENVVQHELSHGLLEAAFPVEPKGSACSGWMTEAFGQWIYRASAALPNDTRFWTIARPWLAPALAELEAGNDLMDRLRQMDYRQGRQTELGTAGALLADFCAAEPLRWEGFARFTARYHAYREARGDFELLLGPSATVSKALAEWAKAHPPR